MNLTHILPISELSSLESEHDRLIIVKSDEAGCECAYKSETNDCFWIDKDQSGDKTSMYLSNQNRTTTPLIVIYGRPFNMKLTMSDNSQCDLFMIDDFDESQSLLSNNEYSYENEFVLGKNASLNSVKIFLHNTVSSNVTYQRTATINSEAVFYDRQIFVSNCSANIKSSVNLIGKHAQINSMGCLFSAAGDFYYEPILNHLEQNTKSSLDFKVVLAKRAKSFFRGLVMMDKMAQYSEAYQENKNLLLSRTARADSEPRLEIIPNDVRCKHGSATSELDNKQLYYLISRGFTPADAKQMIVKSFLTAAIKFSHETEESILQKLLLSTIDNVFNKNSGIFIS